MTRLRPLSFAPALVTLAICTLGQAPTAQAAPADELRRAIELYDRGAFDEAERALTTVLPTLTRPPERAQAWLYHGLTKANQGELAGARAAFRKALEEDPTVGPDRQRVFPAIVELWDGLRQTVVGQLRVTANEPGAKVLVDGAERGVAPVTLTVPVGERTVSARSADSDRSAAPVKVLVSVVGMAAVHAQVVARYGRLQLLVTPEDAWLELDGKPLSGDALTQARAGTLLLPAGPHRLKLASPNHMPAELELRVRAEETTKVQRDLARLRPPWYKRKRTWAWVAAGTSAAALLTAILVGRSAVANEEEIRRGERAGTLDQDRYDLLARSAPDNARIANIFFALGGAAAVTSVVLFSLGDERPAQTPASQSPASQSPASSGSLSAAGHQSGRFELGARAALNGISLWIRY